jgi:hypothetical protein
MRDTSPPLLLRESGGYPQPEEEGGGERDRGFICDTHKERANKRGEAQTLSREAAAGDVFVLPSSTCAFSCVIPQSNVPCSLGPSVSRKKTVHPKNFAITPKNILQPKISNFFSCVLYIPSSYYSVEARTPLSPCRINRKSKHQN